MFKLTELPFSQDALEPYISAMTISYHYGKHHNGYVQKLNKTLAEQHFPSEADTSSLESLIKTVQGNAYNLAAQVWNHDFYWKSMINKKTSPSMELENQIIQNFRSVEKFLESFKKTNLNKLFLFSNSGIKGIMLLVICGKNAPSLKLKVPFFEAAFMFKLS